MHLFDAVSGMARWGLQTGNVRPDDGQSDHRPRATPFIIQSPLISVFSSEDAKMTTPASTTTRSVPPCHAGAVGSKRRRRSFMSDMRFVSAVALTAASSARTTCAFSFTPTASDFHVCGFTPTTSHPSPLSPPSDSSRHHNTPTITALNAAKSTNAGAKPASVGQQIQQAADVNDLLSAASSLWVPTDDDLPPHYCQEVHHEKRQRWAGQLLGKMGQIIPASFDASLWTDDRLARAIEAAATPFEGRDVDRVKVEGRAVSEAIIGLASVVGKAPPPFLFESDEAAITTGVARLISRAEGLANEYDLKDAVEARWAARTLMARFPGLADQQYASPMPQLDARVSHLPFDIFPLGIDWSSVCNGEYVDQPQLVSTLRDAIPFNFDTITTRTGSEVIERRGTAWVADEGIGALAYSGKLMKPQPLPSIVASAMRATERIVLDEDDNEVTTFFDCALCNHYPDAEAACKFHTDPEHGSLWDRLTCVVSAGDDRRFAFRPIPEMSTWGDWDTVDACAAQGNSNSPAVHHMFAGDIVKMSGRCNDDFWHAVYADDVGTRSSGEGRVSLVFKRAIDRNGKRGHGLSGEGRRSRRRQNQGPTSVNSSGNDTSRRNVKTKRRRKKSDSSISTSGKKRSAGGGRNSYR